MSYFVVMRNLTVKNINALSSNYAVNAAPIMAINLFTHALGLTTRNPALGVAMIHHEAQILGENTAPFKRGALQQRRAATFIDGNDYIAGSQTLSLQPTASAHVKMSLIVEFSKRPNLAAIEQFLESGRIAGGRIERFDAPEAFHENDADIQDALPKSGFWLIERQDLMQAVENPVQAMINALGALPKRSKAATQKNETTPLAPDAEDGEPEQGEHQEGWLVPTVLGYAMTTAFEQRTGVRMLDSGEYPLHAFAEPMLGLAQYVSVRSRQGGNLPIWRTEWVQPDVFITRCEC